MAKRVPGIDDVRTAIWPHDWFSYESYLTAHYQYMAGLRATGQIVRDNISFLETRDNEELVLVHVSGRIECVNDVLIRVSKFLDVRRNAQNRFEVKGSSYIYHAWRRGGREIIRYDNCHGFDDLHRHYPNRETGEEIEEAIELEDLPSLADFVRQALSVAAYMAD